MPFGVATYDTHNGVDIGPAHFAAMDEGVPVVAAAAGTVVQIDDGHFDRHTEWQWPAPPVNFVTIDHGGGWQSLYLHMRRDTVAVSVGESVVAGQHLGLVGSSGFSAAAHVHFEVQYQHSPVDPFLAPDSYWVSPLPYTFDAPKRLLDYGLTNEPPPNEHIKERVSDIDGFPATPFLEIYAWAIFASLEQGDTWSVKVYRPDGTAYTDFPPETAQLNEPWQWLWWLTILPETPDVGSWRAEWYINGAEVGEKEFIVGTPRPEIRVFQDDTYIIHGRTTPIDFHQAVEGQPGSTLTFRVENQGYAPLETSAVRLPNGYSLTETLSTSIAPQTSDTFSVRLDTGSLGLKTGHIEISSNDVSEPTLAFAVEGEVIDVLSAEGVIRGVKFHDLDGDGTQDNAESGLEDWTIYLDANGNGVLDNRELSTQTDINGEYSFSDLASGNFTVREVSQFGWLPTSPAGGEQVLFLNSSGRATVDFGNLLIDLTGDGQVNAEDIDELYRQIGNPPTPLMDLDSNGIVESEDARILIEEVLGTKAGDVNLDGKIGNTDFGFVLGFFGTQGGWASGDTNGDFTIDNSDFGSVLGNFGFCRELTFAPTSEQASSAATKSHFNKGRDAGRQAVYARNRARVFNLGGQQPPRPHEPSTAFGVW